MPKPKDERDYMIYKGDKLEFIGTPDECCEFLEIKRKSFWSKVCRIKHRTYLKPRYHVEVVDGQ